MKKFVRASVVVKDAIIKCVRGYLKLQKEESDSDLLLSRGN